MRPARWTKKTAPPRAPDHGQGRDRHRPGRGGVLPFSARLGGAFCDPGQTRGERAPAEEAGHGQLRGRGRTRHEGGKTPNRPGGNSEVPRCT